MCWCRSATLNGRVNSSGDRDIMVVTDWMAEKMYNLGYVQNLDKSKIATVEDNLINQEVAQELLMAVGIERGRTRVGRSFAADGMILVGTIAAWNWGLDRLAYRFRSVRRRHNTLPCALNLPCHCLRLSGL